MEHDLNKTDKNNIKPKRKLILYACKKCYEADKEILGCDSSFYFHFESGCLSIPHEDECDICGKMSDVIRCCEYLDL